MTRHAAGSLPSGNAEGGSGGGTPLSDAGDAGAPAIGAAKAEFRASGAVNCAVAPAVGSLQEPGMAWSERCSRRRPRARCLALPGTVGAVRCL